MYLWSCLRHSNVLPLPYVMHRDEVDIFLMPHLPGCLMNVLEDPRFCQSPTFFEMTTGWMRDTITGLEYLHEYGVCHLDVKADNILITSEFRAVLCDFSVLTETKER